MKWKILDSIDWLFGYDKTGLRVLLGLVAVFAIVFLADWAYDKAFPPEDEFCEAYPSSRLCLGLPIPTLTPAEIEQRVDEIIRDVQRGQ